MDRLGMLPLVNIKPLIPKLGPVINDVSSFKYPITVSGCKVNPNSRSVFITVISATENFLKREIIRKTWKNHVPVVVKKGLLSMARFVFVLGKTNDSLLQSKIRGESMVHGDILQIEILDFYRSLSFKMAGLLNCMNTNCPKIGFLLKEVDDDIYVNIYNLAKIVESYHKSGNFSIFGRSPNSGFPSHHYNNFGPVRGAD
ncbi:beta-1,3-galactosyltransferase 4-like [Daphnia magna]|uniref:beta-1,3-galactosyltransferase 4-like n=1 Tax=Daphnia magna TaxID=35525 RepID=UPI001401E486|nr:beta-1,3-galactosyltransferase 4-like [Daphnia magna]